MTAESPEALRICLAVPFFSNLEFLAVALGSLVAQTDVEWTAIVVDDASPEPGAADVVGALGDDRIRYVRNEHNLGVAANFNRCLDLAETQAEIVTVFHADDRLEPGYVEAMRRAHRSFPNAACIAPRVTVIDHLGVPSRTLADSVKHLLWPRQLPATLEGESGLRVLMRGLFFYCPSVSYRLGMLPDLRFDDRWLQVMDLDFYARILLGGGSIVLIPEHAYCYRRHDATMTAQNSRSLVRLDEEVAVSREVAAAAGTKGWRGGARTARRRPTVRLNGLLEVVRLVTHRQLRAGVRAARQALGR
ncbi:MAG: glycosyltransferase family 2 protein [Ilumatobacteraceae bacterium]